MSNANAAKPGLLTPRARVQRRRYERGHRTVVTLPGCTLASVGAARRIVVTCAGAWELPPQMVDDLVQVTSELTANAVDHSPGPRLTVVLALADQAATVSVTDGGPAQVLRAHAADAAEERGRGLTVVAALAEQWGQHRLLAGNRVWARIAVPPRFSGERP